MVFLYYLANYEVEQVGIFVGCQAWAKIVISDAAAYNFGRQNRDKSKYYLILY